MTNIVVVFPRVEESKNIRNVLVRNGYHVAAVCTTGAQALNAASQLKEGIMVCGYRFVDMVYEELNADLPPGFAMLLLASPVRFADSEAAKVTFLPMPLKVHELVSTLESLAQAQRYQRKRMKSRPRRRSSEEQQILDKAKALLMEKQHMTEEEAHRYIQKASMDSGTDLMESAGKLISILE